MATSAAPPIKETASWMSAQTTTALGRSRTMRKPVKAASEIEKPCMAPLAPEKAGSASFQKTARRDRLGGAIGLGWSLMRSHGQMRTLNQAIHFKF
jgi:hypothetical protein